MVFFPAGDPTTLYWEFGTADTNITYSSTDVHYTYLVTGTFNLTVNITNAKSFKSNTTTICVEEQIQGLSLSLPAIVELGVVTNIPITMTAGSDFNCEFSITNSDSSIITTFASTDIPHTFTIPGSVAVHVNCSNNINWMEDTVVVIAMERITGVALTPPGAIANVPFNVILTWTTGTDVSVTLWYDSVEEVITVDQNTKQAVSPSKTESVTGLHNVTYIISNPLDPSPPAVHAVFAIEVAISNPVMTCTFTNLIKTVGTNDEQAVIPLNSDVQCEVDMDEGTSVVVEMKYNNGETDDQYSVGVGVAWSANSFTFPLTHTFSIAGFSAFELQVSNGFNSFTESFPVWVMVGVNGVQLNPQPPETFYPPASVTFDFTYSGSAPNDVTCYIEWGDGNNDEYYPCNIDGTYTHEYMDKDGE